MDSPQTAPSTDAFIGLTIGKCRLERLVGRGGVGYVYRGLHTTLQRPVAVKILPLSPATRQEDIDRFLLEARTVARLEHPNIIQVYDVDQGDGFYYLVMQFVAGETLRTSLHRVGRFPWPEACRIAREVSLGLHVAHTHTPPIVHRDIKPGNIILAADGGVRILDFGLVRYLSESLEETRTGRILGTPSYIAPESAHGGSIDQRADIYSLGVTFYFCLTGRKPFEGQTSIEMIFRHLTETPPPVRELVDDIPTAVDDLVCQMMAKRPSDRPGTCQEVAERLAALVVDGGQAPSAPWSAPAWAPGETAPAPAVGERPIEEPTITIGTARSDDTSVTTPTAGLAAARSRRNALPPEHGTPFLGQELQRRAIARLVEAALEGRPAMAVVTGGNGIGKTRFGYEFARMPEAENMLVCRATCDNSEWRTGHEALGELLVQVFDCVEWMTATLQKTVEDWGSTVLHLAPSLADRAVLEGVARYSQHKPERLLKGLVSFLRAITTRCPLAFYLDEFERAAPETWQLLGKLAAEDDLRLLIVVSLEEGPDDPGRPGHLVCQQLRTAGRLEAIPLRPLTPGLVGRFVASLLGVPEVTDELAREVHFLSGGNPRHARLVLDAGREQGFIFLDGESWTTDLHQRQRYVEEHIPRPIAADLLAAALALPATHRQVLQVLALAPFPLPKPVLETLCGIRVAQVAMIAEHLVEARLAVLRQRGRSACITLTSARVRNRFLEDTLPSDRPAALERMAGELERHFGQDATWADDLADLFGRAGRTDKTIGYLLAAGKHAFDQKRYGRAVAALEQARQTVEASPARLGRKPLTRRGFLPDLFEKPLEVDQLYGLLGEAYLALQRSEMAARRFETGTRLAKRKRSAAYWRGLGLAQLQSGDYEGAARSFNEGRLKGAGLDSEVLCHQAILEQHKDQYDRADADLARALAGLGEGGDPALRALILHQQGRVAYLRGAWQDAVELHRQESTLIDAAGLDYYRPRHALAWTRLLLRRGKVLEAHATIDRIVRFFDQAGGDDDPGEGGHPLEPAVQDVLGWIYLLEGDPVRADRAYVQGLNTLGRGRDALQEARLEEGRAAAHLVSRKFAEGREHCARSQELYDAIGCRRGRAATFHLRGRIVLAEGKARGAEKYFGYARTDYLAIQAPWRLASLEVSCCEAALALDHLREAEAFLRQAMEIARRQGDRPTLARIFRLQGERCRTTGTPEKADMFFKRALAALR